MHSTCLTAGFFTTVVTFLPVAARSGVEQYKSTGLDLKEATVDFYLFTYTSDSSACVELLQTGFYDVKGVYTVTTGLSFTTNCYFMKAAPDTSVITNSKSSKENLFIYRANMRDNSEPVGKDMCTSSQECAWPMQCYQRKCVETGHTLLGMAISSASANKTLLTQSKDTCMDALTKEKTYKFYNFEENVGTLGTCTLMRDISVLRYETKSIIGASHQG